MRNVLQQQRDPLDHSNSIGLPSGRDSHSQLHQNFSAGAAHHQSSPFLSQFMTDQHSDQHVMPWQHRIIDDAPAGLRLRANSFLMTDVQQFGAAAGSQSASPFNGVGQQQSIDGTYQYQNGASSIGHPQQRQQQQQQRRLAAGDGNTSAHQPWSLQQATALNQHDRSHQALAAMMPTDPYSSASSTSAGLNSSQSLQVCTHILFHWLVAHPTQLARNRSERILLIIDQLESERIAYGGLAEWSISVALSHCNFQMDSCVRQYVSRLQLILSRCSMDWRTIATT